MQLHTNHVKCTKTAIFQPEHSQIREITSVTIPCIKFNIKRVVRMTNSSAVRCHNDCQPLPRSP